MKKSIPSSKKEKLFDSLKEAILPFKNYILAIDLNDNRCIQFMVVQILFKYDSAKTLGQKALGNI